MEPGGSHGLTDPARVHLPGASHGHAGLTAGGSTSDGCGHGRCHTLDRSESPLPPSPGGVAPPGRAGGDRGSGHSNRSRISELRPPIIKLDRSPVDGVDHTVFKQETIKSLVLLGQSIGSLVLAEGVETQAELDTSAALGLSGFRGSTSPAPGRPTICTWVPCWRRTPSGSSGDHLFLPATKAADHASKECFSSHVDRGVDQFSTDRYLSLARGQPCRTVAMTIPHVSGSLCVLCIDQRLRF